MAAKKDQEQIIIKPIEIIETQVKIVGDTPLIMHAWSEKAKRMMLEAQQGKKKGKAKEVRNPVRDFIDSLYWMSGKPALADNASESECAAAFEQAIENGATFGFPVTAFKQGAQAAAYRLGWVKNQMGLRGAFFFESDENGLVQIESDPPIMREDLVKVGMGTADLRYRGEFRNWSATLTIKYNVNGEYDLSAIMNAINAAGFVCGAGEWRPERDGTFGMYHVATS